MLKELVSVNCGRITGRTDWGPTDLSEAETYLALAGGFMHIGIPYNRLLSLEGFNGWSRERFYRRRHERSQPLGSSLEFQEPVTPLQIGIFESQTGNVLTYPSSGAIALFLLQVVYDARADKPEILEVTYPDGSECTVDVSRARFPNVKAGELWRYIDEGASLARNYLTNLSILVLEQRASRG